MRGGRGHAVELTWVHKIFILIFIWFINFESNLCQSSRTSHQHQQHVRDLKYRVKHRLETASFQWIQCNVHLIFFSPKMLELINPKELSRNLESRVNKWTFKIIIEESKKGKEHNLINLSLVLFET